MKDLAVSTARSLTDSSIEGADAGDGDVTTLEEGAGSEVNWSGITTRKLELA